MIFGLLEDAGREATSGRLELTLRDVVDQLGTRETSRRLGLSQREVQRSLHERGEINPRTGREYQARRLGPRSIIAFRELNVRELRRAGARELRDRELAFMDGSTFELCYDDKDQGEREIQGDRVSIEDNGPWLDQFERGAAAEDRRDGSEAERAYTRMQELFTAAMLDSYGVGGELDICEDDGGRNLSIAVVS